MRSLSAAPGFGRTWAKGLRSLSALLRKSHHPPSAAVPGRRITVHGWVAPMVLKNFASIESLSVSMAWNSRAWAMKSSVLTDE